jgi:hypothetical protein
MTDPEIRLKCLELAMEQARREGCHGDRNAVAEIQTWLYILTQGTGQPADVAKPPIGKGKPRADKSVFD